MGKRGRSYWTTLGEMAGGPPDEHVIHIDGDRGMTDEDRAQVAAFVRDLVAPVRRGTLVGELLLLKLKQAGLKNLGQLERVSGVPYPTLREAAEGTPLAPELEELVADCLGVDLEAAC